jgi:cytochrome c
MTTTLGTAALVLMLATVAADAAAADRMLALAQDRGCFVCHEMGGGPVPVASLLPTAPSFRDIARRYRGQAGAAAHLADTVANGTPGESGRHWQEQAMGSGMFGDHIVSEDEARALVAWILAMDVAPAPATRPKAGKAKP